MCLLPALAAAQATSVSSQPPLETCVPGAPWWQVWRLFSSHSAVVESENLRRLRVQTRSLDSSMAAAGGAVVRWAVSGGAGEAGYEDPVLGCPAPWAANQTRCVLHFSPFSEACVRVEARRRFRLGVDRNATVTWHSSGRAAQRRAAIFLAAVAAHRSAEALSEAYQLHYAMGVTTGVLFSVVLLFALLFSYVSSPAKRRGLVVATTLGYAAALWKYAASVALRAVGAYPRVAATYVAVAAGASVLCTRYVRSSAIFFDAVKAGCRIAAVGLAFHATRSVAASLALVLAFLWADYTDAVAMRAALAALAALLSGEKRPAAARGRAPAGPAPPRDRTNFLHGHRFLTAAEYDEETRRATDAAVLALAQSPDYAAWLVRNHARIAVSGRAPSEDDADADDDDDDDDA